MFKCYRSIVTVLFYPRTIDQGIIIIANFDLTRVILYWFCSFTISILSEQLEAYIDKTSVDQAIKLKSAWDKSPFSKIRLFSDVLERIKRTSFLQEVSQCRVWFHTMHKTMKKNIDSFDRINRFTRMIRDSYFEYKNSDRNSVTFIN